MARTKATPGICAPEEVISVLFRLVDDAYENLDPAGARRYEGARCASSWRERASAGGNSHRILEPL